MRDRWRKAQNYELDFWHRHKTALPEHTGQPPRDLDYVAASIGADDAVLEVGCGPMGAIYFAPGSMRVGIDPLVRRYVQDLDFARDGVALVGGVGERLPMRDASFDVVICGNVLDHVELPRETLQEMRRILKPGGTLILVMHIIPRWMLPWRGLLNRFDTGHPYHLTEADVLGMVRSAGFTEAARNTEPAGLGWYSVKASLANFVMRNLRMTCRAEPTAVD